jgi:uncharacterized protein with von Willebrand factor type A (vWA) domain
MKRIGRNVGAWTLFLHRSARGLKRATTGDSDKDKFADELFARLYEGDEGTESIEPSSSSVGAWASGLHEAASQLSEFGRLASRCRGDEEATALATEELIRALGPKAVPPDKAHPPPPPKDPKAAEFAARRAMRIAVGKAGEEVDGLEEVRVALSGLIPGSGKSPGEGRTSVSIDLARRVKGDASFRRIVEMAGRMKRVAAQKRRSRVRHGADEITDVECGSDLARLLPSELGKLRHPTMRLLLFRSLLERSALQYKLEGTETLGRGPVCLLVDKSGSMQGECDEWASAVALALMDSAHADRRAFALVCFNGSVRFEAVVKPGEALPLEALSVGCGGGTDVDVAVARALDLVEGQPVVRKADVVLLCDGGSDACKAAELKSRADRIGCSIFGIAIGCGKSGLLPWCHSVVELSGPALDDRTASSLFG